MRLEHIPILLGLLVGAIGIALLADAWLPDEFFVPRERRRRRRAERNRRGEGLVGAGTLCLAAALVGRDTWRFGTLSVLIGTVLLVAGGVLNRAFLKEVLTFRGPARRAPDGVQPGEGDREGPAARDEADPPERPSAQGPPSLR